MKHSEGNVAQHHEEPIAIIGVACRFPGGANSPEKLRDLIHEPCDLSKTVPANRFDTTSFFHKDSSHHGTTNSTKAYFLDEDVRQFDAAFFNVQASEADAIDPQQRMLMEVVYDSLCNAGQRVEDMRGSNTAVYVGLMCDDWSQLTGRDWELTPTYAATGTSRAIFSNRVSYFFDWHGPSMTIDTACSSSLVAVHQAAATLRSGESKMAVVAGTNLILSPGMWIAESNLRMLSPTGTSKMWDAAADGYARGEGIAAILMKPLSAAIRDGDQIDCIIRATGVNQDGRTAGITVPSNIAQTQLIRDTYARAGMDVKAKKDRPQFFHAHGTGTPAGDPQEAEAIEKAFFPESNFKDATEPLYVGSLKTVIGHTEGTAGLASLVSTAIAMKEGFIPKNLHYNTPSPSVVPYCTHLRVPTGTIPWPKPAPGEPRRASINSFGFGGTNAHAIIEYHPTSLKRPSPAQAVSSTRSLLPPFTPVVLSAASPSALRTCISDLQTYLMDHPDISTSSLIHTLHTRRSTLAYRTVLICATTEDAVAGIETLLTNDSVNSDLGTRYMDIAAPAILGVFTGQGAQWARMGARLIETSPFVRARLSELDAALSSLPEGDRPDWTLEEQLTAEKDSSRLAEAAISQPLCTAVQILLVDLTRVAGLKLRAVVGHSSGEIGAAYAAGFLDSSDALRIAYYRGLYAKEAQSPTGAKGAMMAVGTTYEDAMEFCALAEFEGRIQVAAQNSPTSVTLSGDDDMIDEALDVLKDEGKFARKLQVDTAYHSRHMLSCAEQYRDALTRCNVRIRPGNETVWLSSVLPGQIMTDIKLKSMGPEYWVDNMTNPVYFYPAASAAADCFGPFDVVVELGPHPALKSPCIDSICVDVNQKPPYTSFLSRGKNDVSEFARGLGSLWTHLGPKSVAFDRVESILSGGSSMPQLLKGLPAYPFDHTRSYGQLSRYSGGHLVALHPPHPLLGRRLVESETTDQVTWRNILSSSENSWLQGHALQGQTVFPAMGYVAMSIEAIVAIAGPDRPLGLLSLSDVLIGRALAFEDERSKMETRVVVTIDRLTDDELRASLVCYSGLPNDTAPLARNFSTNLSATFHDPRSDILPVCRTDEVNLLDTDTERLYEQFTRLGYNYSPPFTGVTSIRRKAGYATGIIEDISGSAWEDQLLVHPGWLDSALQTAFAAYCYPHDNRFWSLHVPTSIKSITINPFFTSRGAGRVYREFEYQTAAAQTPSAPVVADIDIFAGQDFDEPFIQIESVEVRPFAQATSANDATVFTGFDYRLASPDGNAVVANENFYDTERLRELEVLERVGYFYVRQMHESLTAAEKEAALPHYKHFLGFAERMVENVRKGLLPNIPPEADKDSRSYIQSLIAQYRGSVDMRLLEAAGDNVVAEIRRSGSILEHLLADNLLDQFYEESVALTYANTLIGRVVAQIAHRYPGLHIFEVGAGTGGATSQILPAVEDAFATYTYTDVSAGFFNRVQDRFRKYVHRMKFATYDMDKSPTEQGFQEHSYDIVIASNVLHATGHMDDTIANVRRLLKPGGYLIALEVISNYSLAIDAVFGALPGWWAGAEVDSWRRDGPALTIEQWTDLTRKHGFSGVDTHTPVSSPLQAFSVIACQAVDPILADLRDPLSATLSQSHPLFVIGGIKPSVAGIVQDIIELARPSFTGVIHLPSLEKLNDSSFTQGSSVLCLTELDEQFLERRNASKIEALKTLWRDGQNVLWITRSVRHENPYSAIMLGLCRSARFEFPHLNLQLLDYDGAPSAKSIAEALIQVEIAAKMKAEGIQNLLWTFEPEVHVVDGQKFIPRLYPNVSANQRYNTSRRAVRQCVNPEDTAVELAAHAPKDMLELQVVPPLKIRVPASSLTIRAEIQRSVLQAIKIAGGCYHLCAGKNIQTGENMVALTSDAVTSTMDIPVSQVKAMKVVPDSVVMSALALELATQSILSTLSRDSGTILMHNTSEILRKTLSKEAAVQGIYIVFTTSIKPKAKSGIEIYVHEKLPRRLIEKVVPRDTVAFLDMSTSTTSLNNLIRELLPRHAMSYIASDFLRTHPEMPTATDGESVQRILQTACQKATRPVLRTPAQDCLPCVSLSGIDSSVQSDSIMTIVDWKSSPSVLATVRAIDSGDIFRKDGTYWLLGMTGDLGISICHWMVQHGARNVVLSSRFPKVHPRSFESLESFGANIRIMAVDVSNRKFLHDAYNKLQEEMPPVIGVANAAMVLEDSLFDEVQYESIERAMLPKVDGTAFLDQLFYSTPLDFFILFTSVSNVVGTSGQSTYVMANCFMSALAKQRRDIRGVAGSDIALGSVQGLGYLMKAANFDRDYFVKRGYRNLSEQDVHQLFAEAILAGRPGHQGSSQVVTGVQPFREAHAQLTTNPQFQHMRLRDDDFSDGSSGDAKNSAVGTRTRLASVKSQAEAADVVQDAFINRLKSILMIPKTEVIDPRRPLVELGADSIMAVDIRAWFLKELNVDIPVLKILGPGETVAKLVEEALAKLSLEISSDANEPGKKVDEAKEETKIGMQAHGESHPPSSSASESSKMASAGTSSTSSPALTTAPETPYEPFWEDAERRLEQKRKEEEKQSRRAAIVQSSSEQSEPMTLGQKRFWFLSRYVENPTAFNITYYAKLQGQIRVNDLARAVESVAQRHEALRTRFFWSTDEAKTPMQGILSKPLLQLETSTVQHASQAEQAFKEMQNYRWDFNDWSPLRIQLLTLSPTEHFWIIGTHHISMDGVSFSVLMLDIHKAYAASSQRLPPLAPESQIRALGTQQLRALKSGKLRPALEHYKKIFAGIDFTKPIEMFPFAQTQARSPASDYSAHVAKVRLDTTTTAKLKQIARQQRATSFHAYLAALQSLVFRLLDEETTQQIVIGLSDANRLDKASMGSIGNLLNILPIKFERFRSQTFAQAIQATRDIAHTALKYSALPFDVLLDELNIPRSAAWSPLFQIYMEYRLVVKEQAAKEWLDCRIEEEDWRTARSIYDIIIEIVDTPAGATIAVHAQKSLYSEHAAELLARSYANVLKQVADSGSELNTSCMDKWDPVDVRTALSLGRGPEMALEWPPTITDKVQEVISGNSDREALRDAYRPALTYGAMAERIETIRAALETQITQDADKQAVVGVCLSPSSDLVCSLLATWRLGAIYVPLDVNSGTARLQSILRATQPAVILVDQRSSGFLKDIDETGNIATLDLSGVVQPPTANAKPARTISKPDSAAYIIFTSGSTGEPKGTVIQHAALQAYVEGWHRTWMNSEQADVVLQQTAFGFDLSLIQIFAALCSGGRLVIAPTETRGDPVEMAKLMIEQGVTLTFATASEYDMWFRFAGDALRQCTTWNTAWQGGEPVARSLLEDFRGLLRHVPDLRFFDCYGATETSGTGMEGEVDLRGPALRVPVPVRPLPNYGGYIVDNELKPLPVNVPGEIVFAGLGLVGNHYLNQPDLTGKAYCKDNLTTPNRNGWDRIYRSGDIGRLDELGNFTVQGRAAGDTQVKLRGIRIELTDVERVLIQQAAGLLRSAIVTMHEDETRGQFLVAHVLFQGVHKQSSEVSNTAIESIIGKMRQTQPPHMCPAAIVPVDSLPLNVNGKIDRKKVQDLEIPDVGGLPTLQVDDFTATEQRLLQLWQRILPPWTTTTGMHRGIDFFRFGGHSLLLVKLQTMIREEFNDAPRLSQLMNSPELGAMAKLLDENNADKVDWDKEVDFQFGKSLQLPTTSRKTPKDGLEIAITGATGSLGQRVLQELVSSSKVQKIICLVRALAGRDLKRLLPFESSKIQVVQADLPSMPLGQLLSDVDCIVHCAADRNFWDGYNALRPINVDTVKALAHVSVQTGAALHVLSSGAVAEYDAHLSNSPSRPSPKEGYISTKWVAERYLRNVARHTTVSITAHRPTQVAQISGQSDSKYEAIVARDMVKISERLGYRPDFTNLSGTIDIGRLQDIAASIAQHVTVPSTSSTASMAVVNYPGAARICIEVLAAKTGELLERDENISVAKLPAKSVLLWTGEAKKTGLFEWLFTAQDIMMQDADGNRVVTRR